MNISRRQFLQIMGLSAAGAAAWLLGIKPQLAGLAEVSVSRMLMGTVVNLTVVGEDEDAVKTAVSATLDRMSHLETILSRHQANSQLSQLNQNGRLSHPDAALVAVLNQAQSLSVQSNGAFDVTVKPLLDLYQDYQTRNELPPETAVSAMLPLVNYQNLKISPSQLSFDQPGMAVTVDGIAKGFIVDEGTAVLREHGFTNVLVEAGGDLWASGQKSPDISWKIGIQSPRQKQLLAKFAVENKAVATSGDYMQAYSPDLRYHHILDPRTGYSAPFLASATVVAPSAMLADALATAVMVMSPQEALDFLERIPDGEGFLIAKDTEVIQTSGFLLL